MPRSTASNPAAKAALVAADRIDELSLLVEVAGEVHRELGPGLDAMFYLRALGLALQAEGAAYERERWVEIRFRGACLGKQQLDLALGRIGAAVVSRAALDELDASRLRSLLAASGRVEGAVLNFGPAALEVRTVSVDGAAIRATVRNPD